MKVKRNCAPINTGWFLQNVFCVLNLSRKNRLNPKLLRKYSERDSYLCTCTQYILRARVVYFFATPF